MRQYILALAVCAAALPASAQTQRQDTGGRQGANAQTQQFVGKAAVGDMYEIESSKMALDKAQGDDFKQFAQRIIDDHTKASEELKSLANKIEGVKVPTELDAKHEDMIGKLESASTEQFNGVYRSQQLQAHKEAIQLYQNYSQQGDNPELRKFAEKTLPKLKQHQQMAQDLPRDAGKVAQQQGQGTQRSTQSGRDQQRMVIGSPGPEHILGSDLRGTSVYGANGEDVGEVNEIVLNRDGEVVALVVGVGGFLGIGEKDVAIPFEALEISEREMRGTERAIDRTQQGSRQADRSGSGAQQGQAGPVSPARVTLKGMTKQELEAAPRFEMNRQYR